VLLLVLQSYDDCICSLLQVTLLIMNYCLGYHNDPDKSVGPELFFWTFVEWLPVWVLSLAQLYLLRTNASMRAKSVGGGKNISNVRSDSVNSTSQASANGSMYGPMSSPVKMSGAPTANSIRVGNALTKGANASAPAGSNGNRDSDPCTDRADESVNDITAPLLAHANSNHAQQPRESFTSSMQSSIPADAHDHAFPRSSTYNGEHDLEDSQLFDQSTLSAYNAFMSPQANANFLLSDSSMTPSDFLAHVRLSHYPNLMSPTPHARSATAPGTAQSDMKNAPSPSVPIRNAIGSFGSEKGKFGSFCSDHR
jgi:hypothetical protein